MIRLEEAFNKYYEALALDKNSFKAFRSRLEKATTKHELDSIKQEIDDIISFRDASYDSLMDIYDLRKQAISNSYKAKNDWIKQRNKEFNRQAKTIQSTKELYYFVESFDAINTILNSEGTAATIKATQQDSGKNPDTEFISLTSNSYNHPTRKPHAWGCGLILEPNEILKAIYKDETSKMSFVASYNWLDKNPDILIAKIGKLHKEYKIIGSDFSSVSRTVSYYYVEFLNCGIIPIPEKIYTEILALADKLNIVGTKTDSRQWDEAEYYYCYNNGVNRSNSQLNFSALSEQVQEWIKKQSVFNENESRIHRVFKLELPKEAILGLVCNENLAMILNNFNEIDLFQYKTVKEFENDWGIDCDFEFKNKSEAEWMAFARLNELAKKNNWRIIPYPLASPDNLD